MSNKSKEKTENSKTKKKNKKKQSIADLKNNNNIEKNLPPKKLKTNIKADRNAKLISNTIRQDKIKKEKDKQIKLDKTILDLTVAVRYENNAIVLKDGKYCDIYQIKCKDLIATSEDEISYDILTWARYEKTFTGDHKFIGINFPTNTKSQQKYFKHKIASTKNEIHKYILEKELQKLIDTELYCTDREYYMMIFAKSYDELVELRNSVAKNLCNAGMCSECNQRVKESVLFKLANKSTIIFKE